MRRTADHDTVQGTVGVYGSQKLEYNCLCYVSTLHSLTFEITSFSFSNLTLFIITVLLNFKYFLFVLMVYFINEVYPEHKFYYR